MFTPPILNILFHCGDQILIILFQLGDQASDESEMQFEACLVNVKQAIRCYGVEYWKKVELLDNYDANRQPDVVETLYNKWKALSLPYHK